MGTSLPLLTSSQAKAFRACQRLHHLTYELGYRSAVDLTIYHFGTLIHRGLEAWWTAPPGERLKRALHSLQVEADAYERARAEALLAGYDARWCDEPYETIAVEKEFVCPLVNPATGAHSKTWQMAGKFDVIARDTHLDRIVVIEHKTSSEPIGPGSDYWRRTRMDAQISTYLAGAKSLGFEVEACIYDVLGKPGLRPYKATPDGSRRITSKGVLDARQREVDETPDEYRDRILAAICAAPDKFYQRGEVVRLEEEIKDAAYDLWVTGRLIREGELAGRAPRNPDACMRYGSTCVFWDACTGAASLKDESRWIRVDNVHQELTEVTRSKEENACNP